MNIDKKKFRYLERVTRGSSHNRRIQILYLLNTKGNLSVETISNTLHTNYKNAAQHTQRMFIAGLIEKTQSGRSVLHTLTPLGKSLLSFYRSIER